MCLLKTLYLTYFKCITAIANILCRVFKKIDKGPSALLYHHCGSSLSVIAQGILLGAYLVLYRFFNVIKLRHFLKDLFSVIVGGFDVSCT